MIEHIEIEGFKSLEKVSLDLGPLNIFVGTNASGKTNFLEALRVLQGIGYGYTVDEIFNGRPKIGANEAWDGIRGGSKFAHFLGGEENSIHFRITASSVGGPVGYQADISPLDGTLTEIVSDTRRSYPMPPRSWADEVRGIDPPSIEPWFKNAAASIREHLCDVQFLQPSSAILRDYSTALVAFRMGDHGENFPSIIKTILSDPEAHAAYSSWLKELTPSELDDASALQGAKNDWLFAVTKNGISYPSSVLSDGTLRFAAIAAAFFQPSPPRALILEEIEDGLHPSRLHLLIELLKSQVGKGVGQVFATSHSPYAIAWLKEEDYNHVFLCTKNEETGATSITPFSDVPRLVELARTQSIADLFAEGWMENAF